MGFLPSSGCVNTTVQMHHMDAEKTYREKAKQEVHKNAMSYIEEITWSNTPQNNRCMATYLPSLKPSK